MMLTPKVLAAAAALSLIAAMTAGGAAKAAPDPGAARVESLCDGVIEAVKQAKTTGLQARARRIQPAIEQNFNLEAMAQFTIGEAWAQMSQGDHTAVVAALTRFTAARYAQDFEGDRCVVDPAVVNRGPDKLVKSQVVGGGESAPVNYRLRETGGAWKVIDVYYKGVSQLATQRADFAQVVKSGGAAGLVAKLNALTAAMR
jgi:phospholipid transport system substrate-binding protein